MIHFAYGSNLRLEFLHSILPSAKYLMKGYIQSAG